MLLWHNSDKLRMHESQTVSSFELCGHRPHDILNWDVEVISAVTSNDTGGMKSI